MSGPQPFSPGTIADTVEPARDLRPYKPDTNPLGEVPTFGEGYQAQRRIDRVDRSDFERQMLSEGYAPIVDALGLGASQNPGGFQEVDPMSRAPRLTRSELLARQGSGFMGSMTDRPTQERLIAAEIKARRLRDPDFLKGVPDNVAELRTYFIEQQKTLRAKARLVAARTEGWGGSASTLAGSLVELGTDPVNIAVTIATLPLGGGGGALRLFGTEFLLNSGLEAILLPQVAANREMLGEEMTTGEAVSNVLIAGVAGGALATGLTYGAKGIGGAYDMSAEMVFKAMPDSVQRRWADRMKVGNPGSGSGTGVTIGDIVADLDSREVAQFARNAIGGERMTPDERAAINVIEREQEIGEASPFEPSPEGDAAHRAGLAVAMQRLADGVDRSPLTGRAALTGSTSVTPPPVATRQASTGGRAAFESRVRGAESGGNDAARNSRSSAAGRYQFTDDTWARYHRRIYGGDGLADKLDPAKQERLMAALTDDNEDALRAFGIAPTAGNYYLAHFAGSGGAVKLHRAAPGTSAEAVLGAKVIAANPFLRGKSASDVIDWAAGKMGGPSTPLGTGAARLADVADDGAALDAEGLRLARAAEDGPDGLAGGDGASMTSAALPVLKRDLFDSDDDWLDAQVRLSRSLDDPLTGIESRAQSGGEGSSARETGGGETGQPGDAVRASEGIYGGDGPIDPGSYVDATLRGEGRGVSDRDRDLLQYAINNGPAIEAEYARRAAVPSSEPLSMAELQGLMPDGRASPGGKRDALWSLAHNNADNRAAGRPVSAMWAVRDRASGDITSWSTSKNAAQKTANNAWEPDNFAVERLSPETVDIEMRDRAAGRVAELDAAAVAFDDPALQAFEDPDALFQMASIEHDLLMDLAVSPDLKMRIDGDPESEPVLIADLLDDIAEDEAAAKALRACMAPGAVQ